MNNRYGGNGGRVRSGTGQQSRQSRQNGYDPRSASRSNGYSPRRPTGSDNSYANSYANGYANGYGRGTPQRGGYADPRHSYGNGGGSSRGRHPYGGRPNAPRYTDPRMGNAGPRPTDEEIRREAARRLEYARRRRAAMEMRRRVEEQIKKEKKMRRKRQREMFAARTVICLVVFAVLAVMLTGILASVFFSSPDGAPGNVTYYYADREVRSVSSDTAYKNGKTYVCFNDLADYLGLFVTGDTGSMRFVFPSDETAETGSEGTGLEDSVTFFIDSRTVELNGQTAMLPIETYLYGEEVWVSTEFLTEYVEGIEVESQRDEIRVARVADPDVTVKDGEDPVYITAGLKLKDHGAAPSPTGTESESAETTVAVPEFISDLSEYEEYMEPADAEEYLILVNFENTVDASLAPSDLTAVANTRQDGRDTQYMRLCAAKALEALFIEMNAAGYTDVSVTSGYRSYDSQASLHEYYISQEMAANGSLSYEDARQIVLTYSAAAGTSEHQTGLCVDMHNLVSASKEFADEPAYTWLTENAWKFGYILRYPEDKTDVTQISFEPWHWRYVGRTAAKAIHDGGMCLEEYIAGNSDGIAEGEE